MKSILKSLALHLLLIGIFFFLAKSNLLETKETPIELMDFIQKVSDGSPHPHTRTSPKNTGKLPMRASLNPTSAPQDALPSAVGTGGSSTLPSGPGGNAEGGDAQGPLAEEYEVGELPVLVREVRVPYPPIAKSKGIQGTVLFDLVVGSNGAVTSAIPVKSAAPELTEAALAAVKQFRFRPAHLNDKPVAIKIRYTYRFVLE